MFAAKNELFTRPSGGYQISRSLRFNDADTAYLNRTPATTTNRRTWTWSGWVKRGVLGGNDPLFTAYGGSASTGTYIIFNPSADTPQDGLQVAMYTGSHTLLLRTSAVFRDPSAWYHVVVAMDTTQATSSDRVKIYVNGVQITAFNTATYPTQNLDTDVNTTREHAIGRFPTFSTNYDGLMTEVNFIDGQALTPSSFGETNAQTGVWQPKAYSGSYGTNGFYLNFSDNSNTTSTTLGKDYSGNGNNWTPNNFSVTAGAGNDSLVDSPTSYGTDTGVGGTVRGNYCTLNPLNAGSTATLSNGNLNISGTSAATTSIAYATIGVSSGKWYWEVTPLTGDHMIGIGKDGGRYDWQTTNGYSYFGNNGQKYTNSAGSAYGSTYANNDVIGVALDMDAGTLVFYKNNTSQGTAFSGLTGTWFPNAQNPGAALTEVFNFGQRPFAYTAPSGFKALCTQNLPTPTIGATTATQAGKYFGATAYSGTSATQAIVNDGFQPDLIWLKARNAVGDNGLYDSIRGISLRLVANNTNAEASVPLDSFNSNGFSTTSNYNNSGQTLIAWQWRGGGTGSTNTSGSITSTVSVNTTSGFSVVTYTAVGGVSTVGHGLGVVPSMMIFKDRDGTANWPVYHISLGNTSACLLDTTAASSATANWWNNTSPTSSVVTIGSNENTSTRKYVAYCFAPVAGYSAFGSYTGNGSADGPFCFTGFRPAFVLTKRTDSGGDWQLMDSSRDTYNVANKALFPNTTDAETTGYSKDFLSNGFKIRDSGASLNASGGTYIFMAFASAPLKFSLAR
jgi:hypothetical protein